MDSCGAVDVQVIGDNVTTATTYDSPSKTINKGVVDNLIATHLCVRGGGVSVKELFLPIHVHMHPKHYYQNAPPTSPPTWSFR